MFWLFLKHYWILLVPLRVSKKKKRMAMPQSLALHQYCKLRNYEITDYWKITVRIGFYELAEILLEFLG